MMEQVVDARSDGYNRINDWLLVYGRVCANSRVQDQ